MNTNTELSPIAWATYNYLKERTLGTDEAVEQYALYAYLVSKGFKITWNESQNQHNDHCRKLKDIVDEINFSKTLDKMVYQKDWKYCIANEEQANEIMQAYHAKAMLALERESVIASKCKRDGQGKLVNNAGNPIQPHNEQFHEAYNKNVKTTKKVLVTYDEEEQAGLRYSQLTRMEIPIDLEGDEAETYIESKLPRGATLTHWEEM